MLDRRDFVEAAPTLPGDSRFRLPPASPHRYDGREMDGLSPPSVNNSASWRTNKQYMITIIYLLAAKLPRPSLSVTHTI